MRKILSIILVVMLVWSQPVSAMQKYTVVQTNFTSGEISPKLFGRIDTQQYYNAVAEMTNFYVQPYGGAFMRPGTVYVADTKHADKDTRLLEFNFNNEDTYIIEAGDQYMRFYRNDSQILTDASPALDAYTKLLVEFNGTDAATTYTAETEQVMTFVADAQLDTAQKEFGTASALFDGTGDYVRTPDSDDYDLGSGNFTIDCWVRFSNIAGHQSICGQGSNSSNFMTLWWKGSEWGFYNTSPAINLLCADAAVVADTWYHVAVVRNGNVYTIYRDGVSKGTATVAGTIPNFTSYFGIGARMYSGESPGYYPFKGWIDEFRLSKTARWTAGFTPPTYAYTDAATWVTATGYVVDDYVNNGGTVYKCLIAHTSGTFATDLAAGKWTATVTYEITTPYLEAELFDIKYTQSADIIYLAHQNHAPKKLSREGHTSWQLEDIEFEYGPFMLENTASTTLDASATTGEITVVASDNVFDADQVGGYFSIGAETGSPAHQGYVQITAVTDARNATATVKSTLSTAAATTAWAEGSFSTHRGYPAAVALYEQRLFWGGSTGEPQTVWSSQTGDYYNMEAGSDGDDALVYELFSQSVNAIKWIEGEGRVMLVGTTSGPFVLWSGSTNEPLTPDMVSAKRVSGFGVGDTKPIRIDNNLFYAQRGDERLRELYYQYELDGYKTDDATILAEHILSDGDGIVDIAYQKLPVPMIWCVRDDGDIAVFSREISQEVKAWSRFAPGEFNVPGWGIDKTYMKSVAIVPDGAEDQVWAVAKWTNQGTDKQFIVYFDTFEPTQTVADYNYLDYTVEDSSPSAVGGVYTITGLDHLEGSHVVCWADGTYLGYGTVTGGEVDIAEGAGSFSKLLVGLPYEKNIGLLPPEHKGGPSLSDARNARVSALYVKAYKSDYIRIRAERYSTAVSSGGLIEYDFVMTQGLDYYAQESALQGKYFNMPLTGWARDSRINIIGSTAWADEYLRAYSLNILSLTLFVALGG